MAAGTGRDFLPAIGVAPTLLEQADVSVPTDLLTEHPERLTAMRDPGWKGARENDIVALDDRPLPEAIGVRGPIGLRAER